MAGKTKFTALYERLSRDDEQQGESNSISNQKRYLEDYAKKNGFQPFRHFTDDGYTGTNFNRPGFLEMLEEIKNGNVDTVIVKDMSRFGRNYIQVGFYTEMLFPDKGVRFVAINSNIDSANPMDNDFAPFLNIMNEWYAKDTSKKIKAVFKNRMSEGYRCSGSIPYGYKRISGDKQKLYVDEPAAKVVKRIYNMASEGISLTRIADTLANEKVLIPAAYEEKYHPEQCSYHNFHDPYRWTCTSVGYILERKEYLGHTILGKSICDNFKTKKRRKATDDELIVFYNTHEPIIDQKLYDKVQKLRARKVKKRYNGENPHMLSGYVFCADCGRRMGYGKSYEERWKKKYYSFYQCSKYKSIYDDACESHFINAEALEEIVTNCLRLVSKTVLEDDELFAEQLMEQWKANKETKSTDNLNELNSAKVRVEELDELIQNLYESQVKGILPERQAKRLMLQYTDEQDNLIARIKEIEVENTEEPGRCKTDITKFTALIRKYENFEVITDDMISELIEKIVVHKAINGRTRYRMQKVDIYFSFIGQISLLETDISEEERIAQIDAEYKERQREKAQRSSARQKEKYYELKELAETDPEKAKEFEELKEKRRVHCRNFAARKKAEKEANPEYKRKVEERQHLADLRKMSITQLEPLAKDDPVAEEVLRVRREKAAIKNKRNAEKRRTDKLEHPEKYTSRKKLTPEEKKEHQKTYSKKSQLRRKQQYAELKERAKTDSEAAKELAARKEYSNRAKKKCIQKMREEAKTNPEVAAKLERWCGRRYTA